MFEKGNDIFVLDVWHDSSFRHLSGDGKANAYGSIRGAVNILLADLEISLSNIPRNKEIDVIDLFGADASKAAVILKEKGFERVSVLIEGISRWLSSND